MKYFITTLILLISIICQSQNEQKFNLGLEKLNADSTFPDGWYTWGDYTISMDTLAYSGERSGKISSTENGKFASISYKIPANYSGKRIQVEAYMKIENVSDGFAGLLLRVDDENNQSLVFDNMESQNISGSKDWQKYSIELDYPEDAGNIWIAGILTGKGEAWYDDFVVSIDGKNLQTLKESPKVIYKASLDHEFDSSSSINIPHLSPALINDLEILGKTWGFLKYYHPEIAKGNYNWDYELFRILPDYIKQKNKSTREKILLNWVDNLGEVDTCDNCEPSPDDALLKPDLDWINSSLDNKELQDKLLYIYHNRNQEKHYYIGMAKGVGNPIFKNEPAYDYMPYPDEGYRLLALYRFWNMNQYFNPNRHLTDKNWNSILKEYIPSFINAKNELEYEQSAIQLIAEIHDTHANLWAGNNKLEEWKGTYLAPVHLRFIEGKLVVTDYYNPELKTETGLEIGDVISKIDGKSTDSIVFNLSKYYPASNEAARLRNISTDMLRSQKEELQIEYLREGKVYSKSIKLYPKDELNAYRWYRKSEDKSFRLLDNNIGYISLMTIQDKDLPLIKENFKNTRGMIIDIRNYPSTFVPFSLGSLFVSTPTPFVKFSKGKVENPGEFSFTNQLELPASKEPYKGKLIILVNELTQSQAEYTAMAFRAGENSSILGSTTAGADGNVSTIMLPGGLRTMISGIGVYYPNGEETQRVGIIPDVEVQPTIKAVKEGKDELLEKAIELILSENQAKDTEIK